MGSLEAMEHKSGGGASAMDRYFHKESDSVKVAQGKQISQNFQKKIIHEAMSRNV